jgi:hypothetical protein
MLKGLVFVENIHQSMATQLFCKLQKKIDFTQYTLLYKKHVYKMIENLTQLPSGIGSGVAGI